MDSFEVEWFGCTPDEYLTFVPDFEQKSVNYFKYESESEGMLIVADVSEEASDISSTNFPPVVQQSTFLENKIVSDQTQQSQTTTHLYPRESKNYYKNIGPKLRIYILENFSFIDKIISNANIMNFLKIKNQKHTKKHFLNLVESSPGRTIAKSFFRNCRWAQAFVNDNIDPYFRLSLKWMESL